MPKPKRSILSLAAALALTGVAAAAPLDAKAVPADAKWVVHVDVDALAKSETWKLVEPRLAARPNYGKSKAEIERLFAAQLPRDLRDVTLFGPGAGEADAVVVVRAAVDQERVKTLLSLNESYTTQTIGGQTVHGWRDEGKGGGDYAVRPNPEITRLKQKADRIKADHRKAEEELGAKHPKTVTLKADYEAMTEHIRQTEAVLEKTSPRGPGDKSNGKQLYGVLDGKNTMIVGQSAERVAAAADVLAGRGAGMASPALTPNDTPSDASGLLVYVAGDQIAELAKAGAARSPVLAKLQTAVISARESKDGLVLGGRVIAQNAAVAADIVKAVNGFKSMLTFTEDPDAFLVAEALSGLTLKQDDKTVTADCTVSFNTLTGLMEQAAAKAK
jgi:hypothetical protein